LFSAFDRKLKFQISEKKTVNFQIAKLSEAQRVKAYKQLDKFDEEVVQVRLTGS
jgi:hypothetical protein